MSYRVLIVAHGHPELSPGGAEIASYLLFLGLQQREDVEAYYLARTGDASRRRDDTPFSVFRGRGNEVLIFTDETDPFLPAHHRSVIRHCPVTPHYQPTSAGRKPISTLPADSYCAGNALLC